MTSTYISESSYARPEILVDTQWIQGLINHKRLELAS